MRHSRQTIEHELRRRILTGIYPPGSRLPLRTALLDELGPSPLTLQRAMDRLTELGFIHSQGTLGTFVSTHLPSQRVIALVFPASPKRAAFNNRFWSAILREAQAWPANEAFVFRPYFLAADDLTAAGHQQLCADLTDGGLAGAFLVTDPGYLAGSPVLSAAYPRLCIASSSQPIIEKSGFSYISMPTDDIHALVLRRLRSEGRTRIGFLAPTSLPTCPWLPLLKEIGLTTRPEWWLTIPPYAASCAQPMARLLASWPTPQRMDALMIIDDNLVPFATAGILDAGLPAPAELRIAAHANFPAPTHAGLPCLRFGTDVVAVLRAAIEEITRLAGGAPPQHRMVPQILRDAASL